MKGKSMNQLFRYLSYRWNMPKSRITLRQCRQPFEMIRSYDDWTFDKVHSFNYPNDFRLTELCTASTENTNQGKSADASERSIMLLYQIQPCKARHGNENHKFSHHSRCKGALSGAKSRVDGRGANLGVIGNEVGIEETSSHNQEDELDEDDDDLSSSHYLISSDDEDDEQEEANHGKDISNDKTLTVNDGKSASDNQRESHNSQVAEKRSQEKDRQLAEESRVQKDTTEIIVSIMGLLILKKQEKMNTLQKQ